MVDDMKTTMMMQALVMITLALSGAAVAWGEHMPQPAAPSNLNAVAAAANEVSLSWYDNSSHEQGFTIQRSEDGISWDTIAELGANTGEYRDLDLEPETRYLYRVHAFNGVGESDASNQDTVVTPPQLDFQLDRNQFQMGAIFDQH